MRIGQVMFLLISCAQLVHGITVLSSNYTEDLIVPTNVSIPYSTLFASDLLAEGHFFGVPINETVPCLGTCFCLGEFAICYTERLPKNWLHNASESELQRNQIKWLYIAERNLANLPSTEDMEAFFPNLEIVENLILAEGLTCDKFPYEKETKVKVVTYCRHGNWYHKLRAQHYLFKNRNVFKEYPSAEDAIPRLVRLRADGRNNPSADAPIPYSIIFASEAVQEGHFYGIPLDETVRCLEVCFCLRGFALCHVEKLPKHWLNTAKGASKQLKSQIKMLYIAETDLKNLPTTDELESFFPNLEIVKNFLIAEGSTCDNFDYEKNTRVKIRPGCLHGNLFTQLKAMYYDVKNAAIFNAYPSSAVDIPKSDRTPDDDEKDPSGVTNLSSNYTEDLISTTNITIPYSTIFESKQQLSGHFLGVPIKKSANAPIDHCDIFAPEIIAKHHFYGVPLDETVRCLEVCFCLRGFALCRVEKLPKHWLNTSSASKQLRSQITMLYIAEKDLANLPTIEELEAFFPNLEIVKNFQPAEGSTCDNFDYEKNTRVKVRPYCLHGNLFKRLKALHYELKNAAIFNGFPTSAVAVPKLWYKERCEVYESVGALEVLDKICEMCHEYASHERPNMRTECRAECYGTEMFQKCLKLFTLRRLPTGLYVIV